MNEQDTTTETANALRASIARLLKEGQKLDETSIRYVVQQLPDNVYGANYIREYLDEANSLVRKEESIPYNNIAYKAYELVCRDRSTPWSDLTAVKEKEIVQFVREAIRDSNARYNTIAGMPSDKSLLLGITARHFYAEMFPDD